MGQMFRNTALDSLGASWDTADAGPYTFYQYVSGCDGAGDLCFGGTVFNSATRDIYVGRFY
jgi:hypothetical protein